MAESPRSPQSITNALGHTTTYDSYNAHGQPTQITDANGLVTTLAYDLRQRLTDRCVGGALLGCSGGELTHLDYWPTGLLKKVTNPDASYIEYTYDAAHRLTQINDGALNKVVYTLDNMGNRNYGYNGFGDLLTQTSPDTGVTTHTYDMHGRVTGKGQTVGGVTHRRNRLGIPQP